MRGPSHRDRPAGRVRDDIGTGTMVNALAERPVVRFLDDLRRTGGLKGTDIANVTGVSKATVSRWASGRKAPHPRTQLVLSDLHYLVMRLGAYYTPEETRAWLYARHPQLDGRRAIDLIHEGRTEEVLAILDRLDADVYL